MLLFVLASFSLALWLLLSWVKMKPTNFPPGPPRLPVLGSVLSLAGAKPHLRLEAWREQYGPVVGLVLPGSVLAVAVCGADAVFETLRRDEFQGRPDDPDLRERTLNKRLGMLFNDGPAWVQQRRFTLRHLRDFGFGKLSMEGRILEEVEDLLSSIRNNTVEEAIHEHMKTLDEDNPRDFIDVYLREMKNSGDPTFTEDGLAAIIFDLFAAGSDTVSNTLAFAIMYMILYPEVQEKVQKELDTVVGHSRRISLEDRPRLPYFEAVIAEISRINTTAPMCPPHIALKDTTLHGYNIPKGTWFFISLWCAMHDKEHWGDPHVFRPERFLDRETGAFTRDPYVINFGAGARSCLGMPLAKSNLFLFLGAILQDLAVSLPAGEPGLSTDPLPGLTAAPRPFRAHFATR
ncbi:farnesoate epoxidase-like isoform X2 [Schistocerca cancellata]|uniref:farnesoate epoxidase-like isoform X2 n=1 Tax=Schistocerca cancellata TaxID=274614 RepID=UPI00211985D9|nr:farnesoate epoxidase-like isoform X2 [Schistocerca cancellata]